MSRPHSSKGICRVAYCFTSGKLLFQVFCLIREVFGHSSSPGLSLVEVCALETDHYNIKGCWRKYLTTELANGLTCVVPALAGALLGV